MEYTTKDLKPFLQPTRYSNCDHPEIKKMAKDIIISCISEKEKTEALFNWVKENVKFEFGYWGIKASEVLSRKKGMCTNKANLLISFLRSIGIPAGYGILRVDTKEFYGELMCPSFRKLVSPATVHIYMGVFLDNKWIRCDPTGDSEITQFIEEKTPFGKMTGFDIKDSEIQDTKGIIEISEFFANIDEKLDKPPKNIKGDTLEIINYYLKFLREKKKEEIKNLSTDKQIEINFLNWLHGENIYYFNFIKQNLNLV